MKTIILLITIFLCVCVQAHSQISFDEQSDYKINIVSREDTIITGWFDIEINVTGVFEISKSYTDNISFDSCFFDIIPNPVISQKTILIFNIHFVLNMIV